MSWTIEIEHTWKSKGRDTLHINDGDTRVATVCTQADATDEMKIAYKLAAAPKMYEACKAALKYLDGEMEIQLRDAIGAIMQDECDHGVEFDEEIAKHLDSWEIRKRFPRFEGTCRECGFRGIAYASKMHYLYGDW